MVKTSIPKAIVESDFLNLIKYRIKKTYAAQLLEQWRSGNLKFTVSKTLETDGETSFLYKNTTAIKKSTVTIQRKVAMSKNVCWRMSILLHELAHVLHYFNIKRQIMNDETHGQDWMIKLTTAIERGGLKECAKKLESTDPACIYKQNCIWCTPKPKGEKLKKNRVYILPRIHEASKFGGNCLFCYTEDSTIKHLKHSVRCKEEYANLYGPQSIARLKNVVAKEKRMKKRAVKTTGPSVCCFCPALRDKFLFVDLKTNDVCVNKYMSLYKCQSEEGLREIISKEKAKLRKRKQRAKLEQKEL